MQTLQEIFKEIGNHSGVDIGCNDKGGLHTYLETYDKLFEPFRHGCTIMEIGLAMGDSLKLWDRYFKNSVIIGVDISVVFKRSNFYLSENKNTINVLETDATKEDFLKELNGLRFDIVIDDGSHQTQDQINTFNHLKHLMNEGGVYIIEDLLALDIEREKYLALHDNVEIIDMRKINGRFDNALAVIKF